MTTRHRTWWMVAFVAGCSGDATTTEDLPEIVCEPAILEDDFVVATDLGPNADPSTWPGFPPDAMVATTYIQIQDTPEAKAAFEEGAGGVVVALSAPAAGLMGVSTGTSESCGTARTLTVWASEEAMTDFVLGPAHSAAMRRIGDISRGGSVTMSWPAAEVGEVSWANVAEGLEDHTGPAL